MRPSVFITGGTGGIGCAIAQRFAKHPHRFNVLIISRDAGRAQDIVRSLVSQDGQQHSYLVGNITHTDFWEGLVHACLNKANLSKTMHAAVPSTANGAEAVLQHPPLPSILINAAGFARTSPFVRSANADNIDQMNVNLIAPLLACRYMAKLLRASAPDVPITPNIINISSVLASTGGEGVSAYSAAKTGLLGLTRSLAIEYGRLGIRVNALLPGFINTRMTESTPVNLKKIPLGRLGSPDEVADAAMFLALNNYANNCVLTLDGGLSAGGGLVD